MVSLNTYNALGQRVEDMTPSSTTDEAYGAGGNLLVRYTGDANSQSFVPFNGRILAEYHCGAMIFDHPDEIGSATTATDCTGSLVNEMLYYPFGELWTGYAIPNLGMHQEFAKLPDYDLETDQYNTANRHYSPMGRWLSPDPKNAGADPSDPQTWNMYAYVRNNPTTLTDPTGLWDWDPTAGGNYTDEELESMAADKDNKYHKWARQALDYRQEFRDALGSVARSAGYLRDVRHALMGYGTENDSNGVFVGFSKTLGYGATTQLQDNDSVNVVFGSSMRGDFLSATVVHEGVHVDQAQIWMFFGEGSAFDLNHYAREGQAWYVEAEAAQALGMKYLRPHGAGAEYDVWNAGWKSADIAALRSRGINNILKYMNLSPGDTDTFSSEHSRLVP